MAQGFNQYFIDKINNIRNNINQTNVEGLDITKAVIPEPVSKFRFAAVSIENVYEIIRQMKNSKSTGYNAISLFFLKKIP